MVAQTRYFHIGDVLTITTGCLLSPRHMEGVYDILLLVNFRKVRPPEENAAILPATDERDNRSRRASIGGSI